MARQRKSYSLLFKLKVITDVIKRGNPIQTTAKKFKISNKCVRRWMSSSEKVKDQLNRRNNRLSFRIRDRVSCLNSVESELYEWIKNERTNGACINTSVVKLKAIEIYKKTGTNTNFKASNGWLEKFLKRYGLCSRRVSSSGRELPKNCKKIIELFLQDCSKFNEVCTSAIYNMDEASIYLDSPGILI